jgi:dienelactone hydrolase
VRRDGKRGEVVGRLMRRRRSLALPLLAGGGLALNVALATAAPGSSAVGASGAARAHGANATGGQEAKPPAPGAVPAPSSFAVGVRVLRLIDASRRIQLPNGTSTTRTLVTYVRYPALGPPGRTDLFDAPAARAAGPFPLVIFGHGFAVTPRLYGRLLQSWARAGYVVAAPVFPLGNANAPGGPNESDIVNQPGDMSFVISRLLEASRAGSGPLTGLIDSSRIAVSGQSDGAATALAVAYSRHFRDPRVGAAVIMSGAEMSGVGGFSFPRAGPPLLATQGTSDTTNEPRFTYKFFNSVRGPKYLLRLLGAGHLPPYTRQQPQLSIIERVTIAFLDGYLKDGPTTLAQLASLGSVPGVAAIMADP